MRRESYSIFIIKQRVEKWCNTRVNHGHYQLICETRFFFVKKTFKLVQTIAFDRRLHNASVPLDLHIDHNIWRLYGCICLWRRTYFIGVWPNDTNRLTALNTLLFSSCFCHWKCIVRIKEFLGKKYLNLIRDSRGIGQLPYVLLVSYRVKIFWSDLHITNVCMGPDVGKHQFGEKMPAKILYNGHR